MIGIGQLLLVAGVAVAAVYGMRVLRQLSADGDVNGRADGAGTDRHGRPVEDMRHCPVCDTYVSARADRTCERPDCPLTR